MNSVAVIIPTYNRADIVIRCIMSLKKNLIYDGDINYYIGVDGEDDTVDKIVELKNKYNWGDINIVLGPGRGLGANLNNLINITDEELLLQMDDDHILVKSLNINPFVHTLLTDENIGFVRLMGIKGHNYMAALSQTYWVISWACNEVYIPSNRPHLKHRRFHTHYGMYPENVTLGLTEEGFCANCRHIASTIGGPSVVIPLDIPTESGWEHVGESWQLKGK
jgi:glycosyltransferase involved in cell wall biosynthesis